MLASLRCAADSLIRKLTIERSSGYCELSKIVYLHVSGLSGERLFLSKVAGKVTGGSRYDSVPWTNPGQCLYRESGRPSAATHSN